MPCRVPPTYLSISSYYIVPIQTFTTGINPMEFQVVPEADYLDLSRRYFEAELTLKTNSVGNQKSVSRQPPCKHPVQAYQRQTRRDSHQAINRYLSLQRLSGNDVELWQRRDDPKRRCWNLKDGTVASICKPSTWPLSLLRCLLTIKPASNSWKRSKSIMQGVSVTCCDSDPTSKCSTSTSCWCPASKSGSTHERSRFTRKIRGCRHQSESVHVSIENRTLRPQIIDAKHGKW